MWAFDVTEEPEKNQLNKIDVNSMFHQCAGAPIKIDPAMF